MSVYCTKKIRMERAKKGKNKPCFPAIIYLAVLALINSYREAFRLGAQCVAELELNQPEFRPDSIM